MREPDYGKPFESYTRAALRRENACEDRLPDQMSGNSGSTNPGDFTAYKRPDYLYIECKSCQQERFDVKSMISESQWITLLGKSKYEGVCSGYLVWFVNESKIYWISAPQLARLYKHKKSFKSSDLDLWGTPITATWRNKYKPQMKDLIKTIVDATRYQEEHPVEL